MADINGAVLVRKPDGDEKGVQSQTFALRTINASWTDDDVLELHLSGEEVAWGGHWLGLHIDITPRAAHVLAVQIETSLEERRNQCMALLGKLGV